jgi:hypothetical protein
LSEKRKSTSLSAIQVKTWQKTIGIKGKLDIISWLQKGDQIVGIWHNVRLAHNSVYTICDNGDRIKESAKCLDNVKRQQSDTGNDCLWSKTTEVLSEWTVTKTGCESLTF